MTLLCALAVSSLIDANKAATVPDAQTPRRIETVSRRGSFQPNRKSLENYKAPDWYQDARCGIFIHGGIPFGAGFWRRMGCPPDVRLQQQRFRAFVL
ncbi:MAG: alpha-L-fucosidase [Blastocatellia bacterium]